MFQHFGQRLKRDLKQLVDRRLDTGTGAQKVSQSRLCHFNATLSMLPGSLLVSR